MNWLCTGDTHGEFRRFYDMGELNKEDTAVIILGDAGFNTGMQHDCHKKNKLAKKFDGYVYCVMGNHELRPSQTEGMDLVWDENVSGSVWMQKQWPKIRYFQEYGVYWINGHRTLVLGGAYSVDKQFRLLNGWFWNPKEQLDAEERNAAMRMIVGEKFDFILSHTCPISWEPTDLFLSTVNQSKVDRTMELWLDDVKDKCEWKVWMFGHFHQDRLERPRAEMFFQEVENIETVWNRWEGGKTAEKEWWLPKSPNYWMGVGEE